MQQIKVLLLEDDMTLSEIIEEYLQENAMQVHTVTNAPDAINTAYEKNFDILLLDVKVPLGDGFSVLKELRESGNTTPAIFTTSLVSIEDISQGYDVGCDDYLRKPFELQELLLRIHSALKRSMQSNYEELIHINETARYNLLKKQLLINGDVMTLPKKEHILLELFLKYKGTLVSQNLIFETVWDYDQEPSEMSLRVYIRNLRKILGKETIKTIKNEGYCLC